MFLDSIPAVTPTVASHAVQLLEQHFVQQGFSRMLYTALDTCSDTVGKKASAKI